jgi:hypothetical protein
MFVLNTQNINYLNYLMKIYLLFIILIANVISQMRITLPNIFSDTLIAAQKQKPQEAAPQQKSGVQKQITDEAAQYAICTDIFKNTPDKIEKNPEFFSSGYVLTFNQMPVHRNLAKCKSEVKGAIALGGFLGGNYSRPNVNTIDLNLKKSCQTGEEETVFTFLKDYHNGDSLCCAKAKRKYKHRKLY